MADSLPSHNELQVGASAASGDTAESFSPTITGDDDEEPWTLHIKIVGEQQADFAVAVHPADDLTRLYDEVSSVTGLSREQQRLIYRGRLLPNVSEVVTVTDEVAADPKDGAAPHTRDLKLTDIVGLRDGHSIHLVRKHERPAEEEPAVAEDGTSASRATSANSRAPSSETATASLLAALLGANDERRSRRPQYRLREEDWVPQDPGSMESVRQGLLTMHTLSTVNRQFYEGQWIDCRDTVNQWLEATVVDIVHPDEILPPFDPDTDRTSPTLIPTTDAPIPVTDLDGRRRLLLEPCEESESEEQLGGLHYRRRDSNRAVRLLHVHYNGWPVRWDEWLRSDSERLRPFRVRTRHAGPSASPTVQSPMADAPRTHFTNSDDETTDRRALLPELQRAIGTVQELLALTAVATSSMSIQTRSFHLPWHAPSNEEEGENAAVEPRARSSRRSRQRDLEALAPLLDRLGRTLTDAAPHVAAMATAIDPEDASESELETIEEQPSTLGGLLSMLSRDRRRHGSVASSNAAVPSGDVSASIASSTTGGNEHGTTAEDEEEEATVVDPDHRDFATGFVNTNRGDVRTGARSTSSPSGSVDVASLLGAYLSAASLGGLTSVGMDDSDGAEGLGRLLRERGNGGGGIDIHIHAVVTAPGLDGAMGLAALTGGGGGVGGAAFPLALPFTATAIAGNTGALGSLFGTRDPQSARRGLRRLRSSNASATQPDNNDDDSGIFAELYSDSPEPINPNGPSNTSPSSASVVSPPRDVDTDSVTSTSSLRRSRSRSRSNRTVLARGSGGSNAGSQRRGVLSRFFRRISDDSE